MARIYADADVSVDVILLLRSTGHDMLTTDDTNMRAAPDGAQLLLAAEQQRVLITHNIKDYRLLDDAWKRWSSAWDVLPRPIHAGILIFPQKPSLSHEDAAEAIGTLVDSTPSLAGALFRWRRRDGWVRES